MYDDRISEGSKKYYFDALQRAEEYFNGIIPPEFEPLKYIFINPLEVCLRCPVSYPVRGKSVGPKVSNLGAVISENLWSSAFIKPVYSYKLYSCVFKRVLDGVTWEESGILDLKVSEVERASRSIDGCWTREDFVQRYMRLDSIIDDIRKVGFKSQMEIGSEPADIRNEMMVSIDQDGRFYFAGGGNHRLAIAQALRVESIPVLVMARHAKWVNRVLSGKGGSHPDSFRCQTISQQ